MKLILGHYYHAVPNTSYKSAGEEIPRGRIVRIKSTFGMEYCSLRYMIQTANSIPILFQHLIGYN